MPSTRRISAIKIGKRHRKDLGNLESLAESLENVGLLHAIVIDSHDRLIAGRRRLEAAKQLGWKEVPVRVVNLEEMVLGEFVENACRKDFAPSEIASIAKALRPLEEKKAHQRRLAGLNNQEVEVENCHHEGNGKTRDIVARHTGISGRTLNKIEAVVEAAEEEPARFGNSSPHKQRRSSRSRSASTSSRKTKSFAPIVETFYRGSSRIPFMQ